MGGARSIEFYRASIEYMKKVQERAGIPFFKDSDVFDYIGRNTRLEIRNDQRLVISQMLAQPFEMIPEIDNMPWNLKEGDMICGKGSTHTEIYAGDNKSWSWGSIHDGFNGRSGMPSNFCNINKRGGYIHCWRKNI